MHRPAAGSIEFPESCKRLHKFTAVCIVSQALDESCLISVQLKLAQIRINKQRLQHHHHFRNIMTSQPLTMHVQHHGYVPLAIYADLLTSRTIPSFSELVQTCSPVPRFTGPLTIPRISFSSAPFPQAPNNQYRLVNQYQTPNCTPTPPSSCDNSPCSQRSQMGSYKKDEALRCQLINFLESNRALCNDFVQLESCLREGRPPQALPRDNLARITEHYLLSTQVLREARKSTLREVQTVRPVVPCQIQAKVRKPATNKRKASSKQIEKKADLVSFTVNPSVPCHSESSSSHFPEKFLNRELCIKNNVTCNQCGSKLTPEWRSGPEGSRTLCNACGLFFSKLIRKFGQDAASVKFLDMKNLGRVFDRRIGSV